ncbi:MAG: site-specific integrase [Verrucomicrobia bacterium]|nr:site-specific integrase [Verrucomicrobiota bacterium]MDA1066110.1 site-specific integrase [Verrucomicrobiota bacterium]
MAGKGPKWVKEVRRGNVTVKVYRIARKDTKSGFIYGVSWKDSGGKWTQRQKVDLKKAMDLAKKTADELHLGKVLTPEFTQSELEGLGHAKKLLGDVPLLSAVQEWKRANELTAGQIIPAAQDWYDRNTGKIKKATVGEVIDVFLKSKREDGKTTKKSYEDTFPSLNAAMGNVPITRITATRIQDWLNGMTVIKTRKSVTGRTRNTHRKRVVTLFRFASRRGFLPIHFKTQAELTDRAKEDDINIGIADADNYQKLLDLMRDEFPHYLAATVLAGLCGMRRSEVHGQLWADISLERRFVRVTNAKPNTPAKRLVTLCDTAIEWLMLCENRVGEVCPGTTMFMDRIRFIGKGRGLVLHKNCFRDSFISCRIAATGEVDRTALEAGTSAKMIHKHYRELVTTEEGQAWFKVSPYRPSGKVVSYDAG